MLNAHDQETVVKSVQTARFLVQDLQELVKAKDPLFSDIAFELLQQAVQIEQRLKRIETNTCKEENIE